MEGFHPAAEVCFFSPDRILGGSCLKLPIWETLGRKLVHPYIVARVCCTVYTNSCEEPQLKQSETLRITLTHYITLHRTVHRTLHRITSPYITSHHVTIHRITRAAPVLGVNHLAKSTPEHFPVSHYHRSVAHNVQPHGRCRPQHSGYET